MSLRAGFVKSKAIIRVQVHTIMMEVQDGYGGPVYENGEAAFENYHAATSYVTITSTPSLRFFTVEEMDAINPWWDMPPLEEGVQKLNLWWDMPPLEHDVQHRSDVFGLMNSDEAKFAEANASVLTSMLLLTVREAQGIPWADCETLWDELYAMLVNKFMP